jgi:hypothetical protein
MNEIIDDSLLELLISKFAEKRDILQMKYVNERFDKGDYKAIEGKFFVSIDIYSHKTTEITFGIIRILRDDIEEEEWFSLEDDCLFNIDLRYFFSKELLMEEIVEKCKKHKMICDDKDESL